MKLFYLLAAVDILYSIVGGQYIGFGPIFAKFPTYPFKDWKPRIVKLWGQKGVDIFTKYQLPNLASVKSSNYRPRLPTIMIIFGFNFDNINAYSNLLTFVSALHNASVTANFLYLDWNEIPYWSMFSVNSSSINQNQVVGYEDYGSIFNVSPGMSRFAAESLLFLRDHGFLEEEKLHIIGHSVGAHLAGRICKQYLELTGKKVGRITGLDPFGALAPYDNEHRLSIDDAEYVEVYYTNLNVFGVRTNALIKAHMSFTVNDGKSHVQCEESAFFSIPFCNHVYAIPAYLEASTCSVDHPIQGCDCPGLPINSNDYHQCMAVCPGAVVAGIGNPGREFGFRNIYLPLSPSVARFCQNPRYTGEMKSAERFFISCAQ